MGQVSFEYGDNTIDIVWADQESWQRLELDEHPSWNHQRNLYSFDKQNVFRSGNIIQWANPDTLKWIIEWDRELTLRVKDSENIYFKNNKLEWVDIDSREFIWSELWFWQKYYSKDQSHVYYINNIIEWVDLDSFEPIALNQNGTINKRFTKYSKDKNNVYYGNSILNWASSETFGVINEQWRWIFKWDAYPIIDGKIIPTPFTTFLEENSIHNHFFISDSWVYTMFGKQLEFLSKETLHEFKYENLNQNADWKTNVIVLWWVFPETSVTDGKYFKVKYFEWYWWHTLDLFEYSVTLLPEITDILDDLYNKLSEENRMRLETKIESIMSSGALFNDWEVLDFTTNEMLLYQIVSYLSEKINSQE